MNIQINQLQPLLLLTIVFYLSVSVPEGLKAIRHVESEQLYVRVINLRTDTLRLYNVDYVGSEDLLTTLPPGSSAVLFTYIDFPYLITKDNGELIMYFHPLIGDVEVQVTLSDSQ
jgi:hypothetical protein